MKSTLALSIGTILCLSTLLGGCGQPGPLYLPKAPPKPATSTVPGPAAPAAPAASATPSTPAAQ